MRWGVGGGAGAPSRRIRIAQEVGPAYNPRIVEPGPYPRYPLGKLPPKLAASATLRKLAGTTLPTPPSSWTPYVGDPDTLMLGNDVVADCVAACQGHWANYMAWLSGAANPTPVGNADVFALYTAISGWDGIPGDATDVGSYLFDAFQYMQLVGLQGWTIRGFANVNWLDHTLIKWCIYDFQTVHVGVQLPFSALDQFHAGQAWTLVPGSPIDDGHCILAVGFDDAWVYCYSFGKVIPVSWAWWDYYTDEAWITALTNAELPKIPALAKYNAAQLDAEWDSLIDPARKVSMFETF